MKLFYFHDLFNAVKALHYRYGKGDIINIHRFFDGKITITAKRKSCKPHTRQQVIMTVSPLEFMDIKKGLQ